jgi:hypothetical protein
VKIALATSREVPTLTDDDRLLLNEFSRRGAAVTAAVWDDAAVRWTAFDRVVIRSCWDYHRRPVEFLAWLDSLERQGVPLWNPPKLLRWNSHKSYLRDLEASGVTVAPTAWLDHGSDVSLSQLLGERGWDEAVIKPAISASAFRTWKVSSRDAADPRTQRALEDLLAGGDVLVQPFISEIARSGEWSLVFFAEEFSHGILKRPAIGDFRVQSEYGGQVIEVEPPAAVVAGAKEAAAKIRGPWAYARIDGVASETGVTLMEMELIEPYLFLSSHPEAPARFADALAADPR